MKPEDLARAHARAFAARAPLERDAARDGITTVPQLEPAAEHQAAKLSVRLVDGDPAPAIGAILFELVKGAVAWSQGRHRYARSCFKRAEIALATLRVQIDQRMQQTGGLKKR